MRAQAKLHAIAHPPQTRNEGISQPLQETFDSPWRHLIPRKETRLMSDEAQRTSGLFIPYPLLSIMLALVLTLGGGIIGMYVKLDTMNSTMIMRDSDQKEVLKRMENKADVQEQYIRDLRERQAEMRSDVNQLMKRRGGG